MSLNKNLVHRGTDGRVWWDGELLVEAESFEAKVTLNKYKGYFNGDYGEKNIYTGYSVAGTYTGYKVNSRVLKKYHEALATGQVPELTFIGMVPNPSTGEKERVAYYGVIPDEIGMTKFTNNEIVEEEIPWTADSFKVLDMEE